VPDETTNDDMPPSGPPEQPSDQSAVTEGGYSYTVVDDEGPGAGDAQYATGGASGGGLRIHPLLLIVAVLVPAIVVGAIVWFVAPSGGGGGTKGDRVSADVTNVINAFSQAGGDTVSKRYEGELPPGYPDGVPGYPGANLVSSVLQITGADAGYLVVYDTNDSRQSVADQFQQKLNADPWQIEAGQDGRDSSVFQFSKIDDPNVRGLVLAAESKDDALTTIVVSLQVTSGAQKQQQEAFTPGDSKSLPEGFPGAVPQYPGATVIEARYQKQSSGTLYGISLVTKDGITQVIDYYKQQFQTGGLTVQDGDASQATLPGAVVVDFNDSAQTLSGQVTAGTFADDGSYTRVDLQVQAQKQ